MVDVPRSGALIAVLAVLLVQLWGATPGAALTCYPQSGLKIDDCLLRIANCPEQGVWMKWGGTGCKKPSGQGWGDSGCQCDQYCGYKCQSVCDRDVQCVWKNDACYNRLLDIPGTPMGQCVNITLAPTHSPTTSAPTLSPTPHPTMAPTPPTHSPTRSPTTPQPTRSPTTPTTPEPTEAPTTLQPTKSPTTPPPTKSPTMAPTKAPTNAPTPSPTNRPTTGRPTPPTTLAPTTVTPTQYPTMFPENVCQGCASSESCVLDTCVKDGAMRITMGWDRPGYMKIWVYPPPAQSYIGDKNQGMPNALSTWAELDINNIYGTGPNSVFWGFSRTIPTGVYRVCAETWQFTPIASVQAPVHVTVNITRPGAQLISLTNTINVNSYDVPSAVCRPTGAAVNSENKFGFNIGTFTIS